jgi:hypothetical protein
VIRRDGKTSAAGALSISTKIAAKAGPNDLTPDRASPFRMLTVEPRNQCPILYMAFSFTFSVTGVARATFADGRLPAGCASLRPKRYSITTLRPSTNPALTSPLRNADMRKSASSRSG